MTAAVDGVAVAAHAGRARASRRYFGIIGAALAAALLAGCGGGTKEQTYSIGPTADCLRSHGERAARNRNDPSVLSLQWSFLRFHPSVEAAKDFDVSTLSANFGDYAFHRLRRGNVSLIWATGGPNHVSGPSDEEVKVVEDCLRA